MPTYGVLIGRFQPFHLAHHEIVRHALGKYDRLLMGIGSAKQARSPKNPWTANEREEIIRLSLSPEENARVEFFHIRDAMYNDSHWVVSVQRQVNTIVALDPGPISICGYIKDQSSYYLRLFPQWKLDEVAVGMMKSKAGNEWKPSNTQCDATKIRDAMFPAEGPNWDFIESNVPSGAASWLHEWEKSKDFSWVRDEFLHMQEYKRPENRLKYPPTYVTTDVVVFCQGHVLMIRRKFAPGKGLWALPGGFLGQNDTIEQSMLRELREETGLRVPKEALQKAIRDRHVFDHPGRSLRGRTITHGFYIELEPRSAEDYDLPEVKGDDDAEMAVWRPLAEVLESPELMFEDHASIVTFFTSRH